MSLRKRVTAKPEIERRRQVFPAHSYRIPTDQDLGRLAALLLEPQSADSFFQWGSFLEVLQRTEYSEAYVMEPLAERMMEENHTAVMARGYAGLKARLVKPE